MTNRRTHHPAPIPVPEIGSTDFLPVGYAAHVGGDGWCSPPSASELSLRPMPVPAAGSAANSFVLPVAGAPGWAIHDASARAAATNASGPGDRCGGHPASIEAHDSGEELP
jgi:hypothetical protein